MRKERLSHIRYVVYVFPDLTCTFITQAFWHRHCLHKLMHISCSNGNPVRWDKRERGTVSVCVVPVLNKDTVLSCAFHTTCEVSLSSDCLNKLTYLKLLWDDLTLAALWVVKQYRNKVEITVIIEVSWEGTPCRLVLMALELETAKYSDTPLTVSQATQRAIREVWILSTTAMRTVYCEIIYFFFLEMYVGFLDAFWNQNKFNAFTVSTLQRLLYVPLSLSLKYLHFSPLYVFVGFL